MGGSARMSRLFLPRVLKIATVVVLCCALGRAQGMSLQKSIVPSAAAASVPASMPALDVTTFDPALDNATLPVLVEFNAVWCPYCKRLAPHLDKMRMAKLGQMSFYGVDADRSPELIMAYQVNVLPTLMIFYRGKLISRADGAAAPEKVAAWIDDVQGDIAKLPADFPKHVK